MARSKGHTKGPGKATPVAQAPEYAPGDRVRVWWPPTTDKKKTDYAGCYWPVEIVSVGKEGTYKVQYDNGELEMVSGEHVHPRDPPFKFGTEKIPIQEGEFVEVFNGSETDPAAWLGRVHHLTTKHYVIEYPFHDSPRESIKASRMRRARLWDQVTESWRIIKPSQEWEDGEIESPSELETISSLELARILHSQSDALPDPDAASPKGKKAAPKKAAATEDAKKGAGASNSTAAKPAKKAAAKGGVTKKEGKKSAKAKNPKSSAAAAGSSKRKGKPERART